MHKIYHIKWGLVLTKREEGDRSVVGQTLGLSIPIDTSMKIDRDKVNNLLREINELTHERELQISGEMFLPCLDRVILQLQKLRETHSEGLCTLRDIGHCIGSSVALSTLDGLDHPADGFTKNDLLDSIDTGYSESQEHLIP